MSELSEQYYRIRNSETEIGKALFDCPASLKERLDGMTNKEIMRSDGMDQYTRLFLVCAKYGGNILKKAELKQNRLAFKGAALNFNNPHFMKITTVGADGDTLKVRGFICGEIMGMQFSLSAVDKDGRHLSPELERFEQKDVCAPNGEPLSKGWLFYFSLPADGAPYIFVLTSDYCSAMSGSEVKLDPSFDESTALTRDIGHSYTTAGEWIVSYTGGELHIDKYSDELLEEAERRFRDAIESSDDETAAEKWRDDMEIRKLVSESKLQNRVAFISTRSSGELSGNMQYVYSHVTSDKAFFNELHMKQDQKAVLKAARLAYTSKVIVTDDYLFLLRIYGKAKGQKAVQLWHATGALKKFGLEGTSFFPDIDAKYHEGYDLVTVSSEYVRKVYARAFNVRIDKVQATGTPRTDEFFDDVHREAVLEKIYGRYSVLKDKKVLLYAPTFRDVPGRDRSRFIPDLDYGRLSEVLGDEQIMVICPHPLMTEPLLDKEYSNILEVRDLSTNDMMYAADLLITDYSSVAFEYSLFGRPMLFYCYDFDDYDRDFNLDYDSELPGDVIKTQDEFLERIKSGEYETDSRTEEFRKKFMGACDGHSSQRVAELIDKMVKSE